MMGIVDKLQRIRKTQRGFTIVEVMIVLAITGVLFVSITATLQGKRQKAEFQQAINAVKTEIEQSISEVQAGYYPSDESFSCVGGSVTAPGAATEQGANKSCIFAGKVLVFGYEYADVQDEQHYGVYTLTGANNKEGFVESDPSIVDNESTQELKPLQFGLQLVSASSSVIAFIPSFGTTGHNLVHGSLADNDILKLNSPPSGLTDVQVVSYINNNLESGYDTGLNPPSGIRLCFRDGYDPNRSGLITIGGRSGTSTVSLSIKGTGNCT